MAHQLHPYVTAHIHIVTLEFLLSFPFVGCNWTEDIPPPPMFCSGVQRPLKLRTFIYLL